MGQSVQVKRRIGLLGGSFNPAHEGHLHISQEALKRLDLDEVWWLVAPQNPLKSTEGMEAYETRLACAQLVACDQRIWVSDIEAHHGLYYTIDSIAFLQRHYHDAQFVWLMGADNLANFHRWRAWEAIADLVPIAVLDRAPYGLKALKQRFARKYAPMRLPERQARQLAGHSTPAWVYLSIPRHPLSATALRKTLGKAAYLRNNSK
jgi:nicotinate-nucleotide adenylyltransferase